MSLIVWQFGSSNPDNAGNFARISHWWAGLGGQEVQWRQRLLTPAGNASELDWEPQRFDETFIIAASEIRGITLYYQKPGSQGDRSTTPQKLELDTLRQQLYVYPQSQKDLVIRVGLPQVTYQQVKLNNPQVAVEAVANGTALTFRDEAQLLEVQVRLSPEALAELKRLMG
ncbi:hypothetical protein IFO70_27860 [Phormidium tenue FACHB-886]|nr:hypothetical protein [Phormidium tenue FACHB-886]